MLHKIKAMSFGTNDGESCRFLALFAWFGLKGTLGDMFLVLSSPIMDKEPHLFLFAIEQNNFAG